jgi:DnaJ homolog subfamily C member 19
VSYLVLLALIAGLWWWNTHRAPAAMSEVEARKLLGVSAEADASEVRAAHHRLITRVHPDAGGSAGLAARVNAARDLLVQKLERR